jgi:hypothetical protein
MGVSILIVRRMRRQCLTQPTANCHIQSGANSILQAAAVISSNSSLVVGYLFIMVVLLEAGDKVNNVAIVSVESIARPIAANHDGSWVFSSFFVVPDSTDRFWKSSMISAVDY